MATSSIIGAAEREFGQKEEAKKTLGKDDFLQLLVTQLQNQDPLNPMDDKEFIAQLAQFSSLEYLGNISTGIENLQTQGARQEMIGAAGYIGMQVRASGDAISKKEDGTVSKVFFTLPSDILGGDINIIDSGNNIIRTELLGAATAGQYEYQWDGKDANGEDVAQGQYYIYMRGVGVENELVQISTEVSGIVAAVQSENNEQYLRLDDGRFVRFMNVVEILGKGNSDNNNGGDDGTVDGDGDGNEGDGGDGSGEGDGSGDGDDGTGGEVPDGGATA